MATGSRVEDRNAEPIPAAWYSDDGGANWTLAEVPVGGPFESMRDLVPFGDGLVAIGDNYDSNTSIGNVVAWVTTDGATWEPFGVAADAQAPAIAAVDGGLVAVGNTVGQDLGPGRTWTSPQGQAWEPGEELGTGTVRLSGVAGNGDVGVAVGGVRVGELRDRRLDRRGVALER